MTRMNRTAALLTLLLTASTSVLAVKPLSPATKGACTITVAQGGEILRSKLNGRVRSYDLKAAPFRLEVSSARCRPSVGVLASQQDFQYVANSRTVVTPVGFAMASTDDLRDVLFLRSENPQLVDGFEGAFDSYKSEYEALCTQLKTCPLKVRAYRSYWNFSAEQDGESKTYADINRITSTKPASEYQGDVFVVVYTEVKEGSSRYMNVLDTHPIVLRFK
jgi:hypothetical protein